jgi:sulfotransferase family protein
MYGAAPVAESPSGIPTSDVERLVGLRKEYLVPVDQPLAVVSQLIRCGGSLTNQLLDGHPQVHAHPKQLHIGSPKKTDWPRLDLDAGPEEWLEILREGKTRQMWEAGFSKGEWGEQQPFALMPSLLDRLFLDLCSERRPTTEREVLDSYWTAYYNAWLDNRSLYFPDKRWVVGFAPGLMWGEGLDRFFEVYPDGRLICSVRHPCGWYHSARKMPTKVPDLQRGAELWNEGAREILRAVAEHPDAVHVHHYEDLVLETERVMRELAGFLAIDFDPILLEPTFNGMSTWANSSYPVGRTGILPARPQAWQTELPEDDQRLLRDACGQLYEEVSSAVDMSRNVETA